MTGSNIKTEETVDISEENNSPINNQNNDEVDVIDNDIPKEDKENGNIIDDIVNDAEITDGTNTYENNKEEDDEDEYFSSVEDMYNFNIDVLSSVNSVKDDINRRLMTRKLKLAKENSGLMLMFKVLFSFFMFFYIKSCTNNLLSQLLSSYNLIEKGFIFKTTIFLLKKLHIIIFLSLTSIGHIFLDILLLFLVEIIDVFIFILNRFDYNVITAEYEIMNLKNKEDDDNKDNRDSNNNNSYTMMVIGGVLYIFINGILVPLSLFLKSINKSIAISGNWLSSNLFLSKNDPFIKKQPNMNIKKSRSVNSLEDKQPTKDKNIDDKKRSLFDKLKGRIKKYLDNIVEKNDLLANSLRGEGKIPKGAKTTSRTLGTKGGKSTTRGNGASKGRGRGRDGTEREDTVGGNGKGTDTKGKDNTSKEQGKSNNNEREAKGGRDRQMEQGTTAKIGQRGDNNSRSDIHDGINSQFSKGSTTQKISNNGNQGISTNNTTKTDNTAAVEPPKSTKQPSNFDFSNKKISEDFIDKIERYELLVNGKVYDLNKDGRCAGMSLDDAKEIAARRNKGLESLNKVEERLENFREKENQSKDPNDKKRGQSEQVDTVTPSPAGAVGEDKNKGDVGKEEIFKYLDEGGKTFNEQPQEKEQLSESRKKLEEMRKNKLKQQKENITKTNNITEGLKGIHELKNPGEPKTKNNWVETVQSQTDNSKSQVKSPNQTRGRG